MNDREMLELAAKAQGYKYMNNALWDGRDVVAYSWNPLTDDGDALRLAVKSVLDIEFVWDDVPEETAIACVRVTAIGGEACIFEELGFDPCAATRRAIVRAAAEVGKNA